MNELIRLKKSLKRVKDPLIAAMIQADIDWIEIQLGIADNPYTESRSG
jgi:hypothetical protein